MPAHSPPSPSLHPSKRARQSSPGPETKDSPVSAPSAGATPPTSDFVNDGPAGPGAGHGHLHAGAMGGGAGMGAGMGMGMGIGKAGQSSSFRNVSACNRCRLRKNRCDQKLPSCASCEKANVACVGYDPITKREIPRSYIFYLEKRVEQLEGLLDSNSIAYPPAESLDYCSKTGNGSATVRSPTDAGQSTHSEAVEGATSNNNNASKTISAGLKREELDDTSRLQRLVSKSELSGVPGAANPRYLGSASGISFARVVFAAVQSSVSDQKSTSDKGGVRPYKPIAGGAAGAAAGGTSMRDSFFGLHSKPTIHPAPFPEKDVAQKLVTLYFEHANPQLPVLHKGEFMEMFEQAYAENGPVRGPKELYMLNMVFAIGGGIILGDSGKSDERPGEAGDGSSAPSRSRQAQPEEYHASAIVHLEACLGSGGGLEELQAVLLLANFALLRPVPPGLWYIIGVAVRLAVDLGLHYEDGKDIETGLGDPTSQQSEVQRERGRREYVRDLRRRLWWSTYSFDRLVSVCVGRPFGISDQVITTEFPSLLQDHYITPNGFLEPPRSDVPEPTYKLVAHHYFRLRLLQSEILQVLQIQQAQIARASGLNQNNPHMHTSLPSPFLARFDSFRSWRIDIDRRLWEWKNTAPTRQETGVAFTPEFFDLNYWQAIIMLYRQSLSVPAMFEGEYHTSKEVNSPTVYSMELREDEDRVYLKVAEAGQKILRLYRHLHRMGLVNYTYLATHHLFMAGISYLYAIWHSPIVRSRLTVDEVDFTILAAHSVFTDLMDKCPPAEACRDAFDRTARATIKMANSTGGFGQDLPGVSGRGVNLKRRTSGSRGADNSIDQRMDWGSSRSVGDNLSVSSSMMSGSHNRQRHHQQHAHQPHHHQQQHHSRQQADRQARQQHQQSRQFDLASDVYSNSAASVSASSALAAAYQQQQQQAVYQKEQQQQQFRIQQQFQAALNAGPIKSETDGSGSGFAHLRNLPPPPRSNASSNNADASGQQQQLVTTPDGSNGLDIDPSMMPSPRVLQQQIQQQQNMVGSPVVSSPGSVIGGPASGLGPGPGGPGNSGGRGGVYSPSFGDLQGMDFLQSLSDSNNNNSNTNNNSNKNNNIDLDLDLDGPGGGIMNNSPSFLDMGDVGVQSMDLGFGLGWEGLHHDFSEGQQLDLFDGFFFGGQQGNGGLGGGGGAGGAGGA